MSGFWAFVGRALGESLDNWRSALFRMLFQPLIYLLVFGKILGRALPDSGYSLVVAPGIVSMLRIAVIRWLSRPASSRCW